MQGSGAGCGIIADMENTDIDNAEFLPKSAASQFAHGFSTKITESECVAELFKRYQALVEAKGVGI